MEVIRKQMRLLEQTLTVYQSLHQQRIRKQLLELMEGMNMSQAAKILNSYLKLYKSIKIETGSNSTVLKFHYIQHILDVITYFDSSRTFDSATSESNFDLLFKKPASQTQKHHQVFDKQSLKNYRKQQILQTASMHAGVSSYMTAENEELDNVYLTSKCWKKL